MEPIKIASEHEPTDYFTEDFERWRTLLDSILRQDEAGISDSPPEGYRFIGHVDRVPVGFNYALHQILSRHGFNSVLVVPNKPELKEHFRAVFESLDHSKKINEVINIIRNTCGRVAGMSFFNLSFGTPLILDRESLLPIPIGTQEATPEEDNPLGSEEADLVRRAFMTLTIIDHYYFALIEAAIQELPHRVTNRKIYNQCRNLGLKPLGIEEIYGFMNAQVRRVLAEHPELRPQELEAA